MSFESLGLRSPVYCRQSLYLSLLPPPPPPLFPSYVIGCEKTGHGKDSNISPPHDRHPGRGPRQALACLVPLPFFFSFFFPQNVENYGKNNKLNMALLICWSSFLFVDRGDSQAGTSARPLEPAGPFFPLSSFLPPGINHRSSSA